MHLVINPKQEELAAAKSKNEARIMVARWFSDHGFNVKESGYSLPSIRRRINHVGRALVDKVARDRGTWDHGYAVKLLSERRPTRARY